MYVGALSPEVTVVTHLNMYYQIASWASLPGMAFLGHSKVYTIIDTLWNVDRLFCVTVRCATTSACHAWISDDLSRSVTSTTNLLNDERSLANRLETLSTAATAC